MGFVPLKCFIQPSFSLQPRSRVALKRKLSTCRQLPVHCASLYRSCILVLVSPLRQSLIIMIILLTYPSTPTSCNQCFLHFFISAYFHSTFSFLLLPYTPVVYRPYAHAAYMTLTCILLHLVSFSFPRLVPDFSYGSELAFRKLGLTVRSLLDSSAKDPRRFYKGHPFSLSSARIGLGPCLSGLSNLWSLEG